MFKSVTEIEQTAKARYDDLLREAEQHRLAKEFNRALRWHARLILRVADGFIRLGSGLRARYSAHGTGDYERLPSWRKADGKA